MAQQVRKLEAELGCALFERQPRGLALTAAGVRLQSASKKALRLLDDAIGDLRPDQSEITLSAPPTFSAKWLVSRIGDFNNRHPDLALRVLAEEKITNFQRGGVDIAVRQGAQPRDGSLQSRMLSGLDLQAVVAPNHPAAGQRFTAIGDFSGQILLQDTHNYWDELLEQANLRPANRVTNFNQTGLAIDAAMNGQGITLAPTLFVTDAIRQGSLTSLWQVPSRKDTGFYVLWPSSKETTTLIAVVDWLLSYNDRARTAAQ